MTIQAATADDLLAPRARKARLWGEFLLLFVAAPLLPATVLSPREAFPLLFGVTVVGVALLALTPGFRWRSLVEGGFLRHWRATFVFASVSAALVFALTLWLVPWRLFELPLRRTELWLMIVALYPILSVIPQELLYRALFFERYGALFPSAPTAIVANAAVFSLGHAFYMNGVAIGLTFLSGLAFAWSYRVARSFPLTLAWHAIGGWLVFSAGLGIYFYHGAAPG